MPCDGCNLRLRDVAVICDDHERLLILLREHGLILNALTCPKCGGKCKLRSTLIWCCRKVTTERKNKKVIKTENVLDKLKGVGEQSVFKCHTCCGDYHTLKCSCKGAELLGGTLYTEEKEMDNHSCGSTTDNTKPVVKKSNHNKAKPKGRKSIFSIQISNLSESTTRDDLEDLVKPFGVIQKLYVALDKDTGLCKGFCYVHFKFKADAENAIAHLNGLGYDHLILNVDWTRPPT